MELKVQKAAANKKFLRPHMVFGTNYSKVGFLPFYFYLNYNLSSMFLLKDGEAIWKKQFPWWRLYGSIGFQKPVHRHSWFMHLTLYPLTRGRHELFFSIDLRDKISKFDGLCVYRLYPDFKE